MCGAVAKYYCRFTSHAPTAPAIAAACLATTVRHRPTCARGLGVLEPRHCAKHVEINMHAACYVWPRAAARDAQSMQAALAPCLAWTDAVPKPGPPQLGNMHAQAPCAPVQRRGYCYHTFDIAMMPSSLMLICSSKNGPRMVQSGGMYGTWP